MNPPLLSRGFPYFGMGTAPVSPTNPSPAMLYKPMWTSTIGFSTYPSIWPSFPPWNHLQRPFFSLADLNAMVYGHLRKTAEETGNPHFPQGFNMGLLPFPSGHFGVSGASQPSPRCENISTIEHEPTDLPHGLAVFHSSILGIPRFGVFSKTDISKGTRFGPYRGRIIPASDVKPNEDCSSMWEVFDNGKLSHYIDGKSDTGTSSWMSLIQCARNPVDQNMEAIQQDGEIFFQTTRDIAPHVELLVGHSPDYDSHHVQPLSLKKSISPEKGSKETEDLPSVESQGFSCERCGKMFTYKYYLDKHLKFTRCVDMGNRGFPCPVCDRSFEKRDRLRIHILHVHEKYKPHVCAACGKAFSQSSSLNKHIRVHTGVRPYRCVHCAKTFTASSILRTHIRQHSGEKPFKCKFCGKSFASHAAHDSHVRRTHTTMRPVTHAEEDNEELLVDI